MARGGEGWGKSQGHQYLYHIWGCWVCGCCQQWRWWGTGVESGTPAGGTRVMGPAACTAQLTVLTGSDVAGGWSNMCLFLSCYWVLWRCSSATAVRRLGFWALPALLPQSASSVHFSPPTFRCTDVWTSLVSWWAGQRNLCWILDPSHVVD